VPQAIREELHGIPGWSGEQSWFHGVGCAACQHTGYRGRTGIYELIRVDDSLQALVARNASQEHIRAQVEAAPGWRSLRHDGLLKAGRGLTSLEEVLRVVSH
jgi:general secretion pathway protein E